MQRMRSYNMSYDVFKRSFTSSNRNQNQRSEEQKTKIKYTNKLKTVEKENKGEGLPPNAKNHYNTTANYERYVYCIQYCFSFWFEITRMGMRAHENRIEWTAKKYETNKQQK